MAHRIDLPSLKMAAFTSYPSFIEYHGWVFYYMHPEAEKFDEKSLAYMEVDPLNDRMTAKIDFIDERENGEREVLGSPTARVRFVYESDITKAESERGRDGSMVEKLGTGSCLH